MLFETATFYFFAAILLVAAIAVVTARNPVHSALFLVLSFFTASAIWMLLRAEFLAITLVLVYVGAVMVLFLFVVMMLDVNLEKLREGFWSYLPLGATVGILMASEMVREKLFRLTGDELPYTSTVIIDKFEEEPPQKKGQKRLLRIAATIVVERDGHKAMVIGEGGERLKQIGTLARQELEKLMDAKVFLELWVKVRSGWADDEARVRSFGYE